MSITIRAGLVGLLAATTLVACGKKPEQAASTGTAQAPPLKAHSWMTGFFPYKDPKLAFVVFVEHGGSGGITGAKLVKQMLEIWRDLHVSPVA